MQALFPPSFPVASQSLPVFFPHFLEADEVQLRVERQSKSTCIPAIFICAAARARLRLRLDAARVSLTYGVWCARVPCFRHKKG
jgi:hypothetical protein